jgi:hypothetical protein
MFSKWFFKVRNQLDLSGVLKLIDIKLVCRVSKMGQINKTNANY